MKRVETDEFELSRTEEERDGVSDISQNKLQSKLVNSESAANPS